MQVIEDAAGVMTQELWAREGEISRSDYCSGWLSSRTSVKDSALLTHWEQFSMLIIKGVPGSPYTRRCRSLHFRHIPYRYVQQGNSPLLVCRSLRSVCYQ